VAAVLLQKNKQSLSEEWAGARAYGPTLWRQRACWRFTLVSRKPPTLKHEMALSLF